MNRSLDDICEPLLLGLPEEEKQHLIEEYPSNYDHKTIEEHLALFSSSKDLSFWRHYPLSTIARISLVALLQKRLAWQEMASLHLVLGGLKELILEPLFYVMMRTKGEKGEDLQWLNAEFPIDFKTSYMNHYLTVLRYDSPGVIEHDPFTARAYNIFTGEKYTKLCEDVVSCFGKEELEPILKKFFSFSEKEWREFTQLMETASEAEKRMHLIFLPLAGCVSPYLDFIHQFVKPFRPVNLYYFYGFLSPKYYRALVIPSFTALQNFLYVRANLRQRKPFHLIPQFGPLSSQDILRLKKRGESPLGLYYAAAIDKTLEIAINKHGREVDGFPSHALSFAFHDMYHAVAETEAAENISQARFKILDLLQQFLEKNPSLKDSIKEIRDKLIDGPGVCSFSSDNSPFNTYKEYEKFGRIFWAIKSMPIPASDKTNIITFIIRDMVLNKKLWKNEYNIDRSDLHEKEQYLYDQIALNS